jgi:hypothetical protein
MRRELDPEQVAARLDELRARYVPETLEAARLRLARERPQSMESFEQRVERCLGELRALDELARHLHRSR